MSESELFYFEVQKNDDHLGVMSVRAKDLQTAKDCLAKYPRVITYQQMRKEEVPEEWLENEPFVCPDDASFTVVDPEPQGRNNLSKI